MNRKPIAELIDIKEAELNGLQFVRGTLRLDESIAMPHSYLDATPDRAPMETVAFKSRIIKGKIEDYLFGDARMTLLLLRDEIGSEEPDKKQIDELLNTLTNQLK